MALVRKMVLLGVASKILAQRKIAERMRSIALGIGLLVMSGVLVLLGVIGGIFTIFFALAHVQNFVYPALMAGGISVLIGMLIGIEGMRVLRGR